MEKILHTTYFMRDDEFNFIEIKNEKDGFSSFEFGATQNEESTFFSDNKNDIKDELNDNPVSNNENKKKENKRKEERKEESRDTNNESKESSKGSSSHSSSSVGGVGAVGATVAAAVSVAIGIVSVGAGPFSPEVDKVILTPHETSINCAFDIFNNDSLAKYKVELYNDGIDAHFEKESQIGHNELEFTDLASSTEYTFEIFRGNPNEQQEYTYESIYSEMVSTLESTGPIVLSFDSDQRQGTMSSIELDANNSYTLPVSIFVPRDDEYFAGWKINGEGEMLQPGQTVSFKNDTTLVAGWNKFPTEETVVQAGSNLFRYFPSEPSSTIDTRTLMGVDFKYQYTSSYGIDSKALQLSSTGGFVSTSSPFGGPISKIKITTDSSQSGDVNYTVVYSDYPIYEKTTEGGETQTLGSNNPTYTFDCINNDARYFCLSNESSNIDARIMTMEFTYLLPVIENSFQVYFDANGGKGTYGPYTVRNKNRDQLPDIEDIGFDAPEGYEFAGWKVKGVNDLLEAGTLIGISSDITLVAQWKPMETKAKYTITFEPNGGSFDPLTNIEAALGEVVNLPDRYDLTSVVPPSNYHGYFAGWSEEPGGLNPVDYSYTVNGDTSLYAIWEYGYDLYDEFDQFSSCKDQKADTTITGKGTFIYQGFDRVSKMFFMGYGDQSYFSNTTETAQPIESIVVIFGGPITISVSFSESSLDQYNYISAGAYEYNPPQHETKSHKFSAPSDSECRYFNISAADSTSSTAIVSNIIINYRK